MGILFYSSRGTSPSMSGNRQKHGHINVSHLPPWGTSSTCSFSLRGEKMQTQPGPWKVTSVPQWTMVLGSDLHREIFKQWWEPGVCLPTPLKALPSVQHLLCLVCLQRKPQRRFLRLPGKHKPTLVTQSTATKPPGKLPAKSERVGASKIDSPSQ